MNCLCKILNKLYDGKSYPVSARFQAAALSHPGKLRTRNEDSYFYSYSPDNRYLMAGVADGIGGGRYGDIASYWTARLTVDFWKNYPDPSFLTEPEISEFLLNAMKEVNRRLYLVNSMNTEKRFIGSTLAEAVFLDRSAVIAHAGDSRIYRIRNHTILALTQDHNLRNELKNSEKHKDAAVIGGQMLTQAIGPNWIVQPDVSVIPFEHDDVFLLCSDGLTLHVPDCEICKIISKNKDVRKAAQELVNLTLERGAKDNLTVLLVRIQ